MKNMIQENCRPVKKRNRCTRQSNTFLKLLVPSLFSSGNVLFLAVTAGEAPLLVFPAFFSSKTLGVVVSIISLQISQRSTLLISRRLENYTELNQQGPTYLLLSILENTGPKSIAFHSINLVARLGAIIYSMS